MQYNFGNTWQRLSPEQFALLGVENIAYVKPKMLNKRQLFAIHTADGSEVAVVGDRELAFATIIQNDLEPVSVH